MGCNCGGKKAKIKYVLRMDSGVREEYASLREAQEALRSNEGKGRISKVRGCASCYRCCGIVAGG